MRFSPTIAFVDHATQVRLLQRSLDLLAQQSNDFAPEEQHIPVTNYTNQQQLEQEQTILFRELPLIVGHRSQLPEPGSYFTHDLSGVPIAVVRGKDGEIRAFINACSHRGTRVFPSGEGTLSAKIVCPYHAWAYNWQGSLVHIPCSEAFPRSMDQKPGLVQLPLTEKAGILWVQPATHGKRDVGEFLGVVGEDLVTFQLESHIHYRQVVSKKACNWKLVLDAFLEGYHLSSLHRTTLAHFFLSSGLQFEHFSPHIRQIGPRKTLLQANESPTKEWKIREFATVFYLLFPNTVVVFHPDWVSLISMFPISTSESWYVHRMLIPEVPKDDRAKAHWDRTFELIEGNVFQKEDLAIAENIQSALGHGPTQFRIGRHEYPVYLFHQNVHQTLLLFPPSHGEEFSGL
jgi:glycine betaine catabolism A